VSYTPRPLQRAAICPERVRAIGDQSFAFIPHRFLREGFFASLTDTPFSLDVAKAAVDVGVHCADLGGNTEIVFSQKKLHEEAVRRGVSVIPDCGLAPGMVNVIAAEGIRRR